MNQEAIKTFVTYYLQSLNERTRREKNGPKWGIDWVVYNLGLAKYGRPIRLPFLRTGSEGYPKSKVEAEFGVDLAFLSENRRALVIFVLKDEPLTNKTWTAHDFDRDLRMASTPDLSAEGLEDVTSVTVILAYNKDDQQNGIELYKRFISNAEPRLGGKTPIHFVRWSLSELVEQTLQHILSPALLPERFFGQMSYLSAQVSDFAHGSDAWEHQLVPNWKRFIDDVLRESTAARGAALIPVALIILRQHAQSNPSFETGWIDLVEWAAIALWRKSIDHSDQAVAEEARRFWTHFYIAELDRFYSGHIDVLGTQRAIDQLAGGSEVGAIAAAYVAYWHLARLGLLSSHLAGRAAETDDPKVEQARRTKLQEITNWIVMLANANDSVFRPVLDIDHIQVFLVVAAFRNSGRIADATLFLEHLEPRLYLRRLGHGSLPFLDGANSLEGVFEEVATQPRESLVSSGSSFFVLMLLELCSLLPDDSRDRLVTRIHARLVLGKLKEGKPNDRKSLDLISWIPPQDWARRVLHSENKAGQFVTVSPFSERADAMPIQILAGMRHVVEEMRKASPFELPKVVPLQALILACLRHRMPLPPELWRRWGFSKSATVTPAGV